MFKDCNYDKVKVIHDVSRILWFLEKHAIPDAEKENHPLCKKMYEEIREDLEKNLTKLGEAVSGLGKEGKFD